MIHLQYVILRSKPVSLFRNWLKGIFLPGFAGLSLYQSLHFFRKEIFSAKFSDRASSVSFKFIMALPPTLLLLFSLVPYLPINNIDKTINDILVLITPNSSSQNSIAKVITDFYKHKKNTLLSFSVLLTLYYSSNGMMGLMRQFNKALPGFKKRNIVKRRGVAVMLTAMLIFSVLGTASFLIFQKWAFKTIGLKILQQSIFIKLLSYLAIIAMTFLSIACIYKYGPATKYRWRLVTPGSILATFLIIVTTFFLFWVMGSLVNYSKIYGSIGTLILFILWLYYCASILLVGFELNASIMVNNELNQKNN